MSDFCGRRVGGAQESFPEAGKGFMEELVFMLRHAGWVGIWQVEGVAGRRWSGKRFPRMEEWATRLSKCNVPDREAFGKTWQAGVRPGPGSPPSPVAPLSLLLAPCQLLSLLSCCSHRALSLLPVTLTLHVLPFPMNSCIPKVSLNRLLTDGAQGCF